MGEMPYFGLSTAPVSRRVTLANDNEHDKKEIQTQRYRNRHKSASRQFAFNFILCSDLLAYIFFVPYKVILKILFYIVEIIL